MFGLIFGHECEICKNKTREYLISADNNTGKNIWLCREHLISEFKKYFIAYQSKMAICQPNDGWTSYSFYTLEDFFSYGDSADNRPGNTINRFTQEDKDSLIKEFKDLSTQKCEACFANANTVYFSEKHWDGEDEPMRNYYCNKHGFEKIESSLLHSSKAFNAGIYLPDNGDGLYISEWL